jgi:hypothetical protein
VAQVLLASAEFFMIDSADGTDKKVMAFNDGGDIAFYEDTGSLTPQNASASTRIGNVGIGTTTPSAPLEIQYATGNFSATYNDFSGVGYLSPVMEQPEMET